MSDNLVEITIKATDQTGAALDSAKGNASSAGQSISGSMDSAGQSFGQMAAQATAGFAVVDAVLAGAAIAAFNLGSEYTSATDKIRVQTGATGDQLQALKGDFDNVAKGVPASFDDVATAVATVAQKTGDTGPALDAVSTQILNLARITGGDLNTTVKESTTLFQNWSVDSRNQGSTLDFLFRATQQTGVGFSQLSEQLSTNGLRLREMGFSLQDATALLGGLAKAGLNASTLMPGFNKALATAEKQGKDAKTVLGELFAELEKSPNSAKTAEDAIKMFGTRAGPQLIEAAREGKLAVGDLEKSIAGGSDTINKAATDTEHFGEKWSKFLNGVKVEIAPLTTALFSSVSDAFTKVQPILQQIADKFKDVFTAISNNRPAVEGIAVVIGGILLGSVIALASAMAGLAVSTISAMAPFLAIGLAIAAVVAGLVYAWNNFEGFRNVVMTVVQWLQANVPPVFDRIKAAVMTAFQWIQTTAVPFVVNAFQSFIGFLQGTLWPAVQSVWNTVVSIISNAIQRIEPVVSFLVDFIHDNFGHIQAIAENVWDMIRNVIANAWQIISNIIQLGLNILSGNWGAAWDNVKNILSAVWDTIQNVVSNGLGNVRELLEGIMAFIGSLAGRIGEGLVNAGRSLIEGLWNGVSEKIGEVKDKISGALGSISNLFPHSPAKEGPFSGYGYTSYSGQHLMEDFAEGVLSRASAVADAVATVLARARSRSAYGAKEAAQELLNAIDSGVQINPDFTFAGMSGNYEKFREAGGMFPYAGLLGNKSDISSALLDTIDNQYGTGLIAAVEDLNEGLSSGMSGFANPSWTTDIEHQGDISAILDPLLAGTQGAQRQALETQYSGLLFQDLAHGLAPDPTMFGAGSPDRAAAIAEIQQILARQAGQPAPAANVHFSGDTDTAFATAIMQLIRTGKIQLSAAAPY